MALHQENPLLLGILQVLKQSKTRLGIHQLLQRVREITEIPHLDDDDKLDLFKLNWLLMNGLFGLQDEFLHQGYYLHIHTLDIYLEPLHKNTGSIQQGLAGTPLKNYYLDWQQFSATTKEQVEALLEGRWEKSLSSACEQKALTALKLEAGVTFRDIKVRFRQLAAANHPDRGGDASQFIAIREAYQLLKQQYAAR